MLIFYYMNIPLYPSVEGSFLKFVAIKNKGILHWYLLWHCLQTSYGISVDIHQVDEQNVYIFTNQFYSVIKSKITSFAV